MRCTLFSLFLSATPLLATPIPLILRQDAEASAANAQATAPAASLDNRPFAPSGQVDPARVLATPRPIVSSYLMELEIFSVTKNDRPRKTGIITAKLTAEENAILASINEAARKFLDEDAKAAAATVDERTGLSAVDIERPEAYREYASDDMLGNGELPYFAMMRHEHDEMVVIALVIIFLLVVAIVEFQDRPSEQSIRLEDMPESVLDEKQALARAEAARACESI